MPIYLELVDFNEMISVIQNPRFINEIDINSEEDFNEVINQTTIVYDNRSGNDQISLLPKCQCGYLHFKGANELTCPKCGTVPTTQVSAEVETQWWFKKPENITRLMNPVVFHMLQDRFSANGWDAIAYITDPFYTGATKIPTWLAHVQNRFPQRGWNFFIENFDEIIEFLMSISPFKCPRGEEDYLKMLIKRDYNKVFCDFIPLPNKLLFPYEKTNFCIYRSGSSSRASGFIQLMMSIDSPIQELSQKSRESRLAKLYRTISEYQYHHVRTEISPKEGEVKRHNLGSKTVLSGRTVIISKTGPQHHEDVGIPWFMTLAVFRPVFINKLMRRGYSLNQAVNLLRKHTTVYSQLLSDIMDEMLDEAPNGAIHILYDRNPSLKHGSMQLGKIYFKRDPSDRCMDHPIANVKSSNADFDGDENNIQFLLDQYLVSMADTFAPWTNVFELTKPFKISNNVYVSDPQVSTYANFLRKAKERKSLTD